MKEFLGRQSVRYAIIVCAHDEAKCPRVFPFARQTLYCPFDDPATPQGSGELQLAKFRRVRDEIAVRVGQWLRGLGPSDD